MDLGHFAVIRTLWFRRTSFVLAVMSVWACGVNCALHYWWDALGSVLAAMFFWFIATTGWEFRLRDPEAE